MTTDGGAVFKLHLNPIFEDIFSVDLPHELPSSYYEGQSQSLKVIVIIVYAAGW